VETIKCHDQLVAGQLVVANFDCAVCPLCLWHKSATAAAV